MPRRLWLRFSAFALGGLGLWSIFGDHGLERIGELSAAGSPPDTFGWAFGRGRGAGTTPRRSSYVDSTSWIQAAIHRAAAIPGGGEVRIPVGEFLSGPLELVSGVTLFLERGAVLKARPDIEAWPTTEPLVSYGGGREGSMRLRRVAFLTGAKVSNVTITGDGGTIDGNGPSWWDFKQSPAFDDVTLPHLIEFRHARNVRISRVLLQNSPMWTVHPFDCTHVLVSGVRIDNPVSAKNTDGINPDSCRDVIIEDVVYRGGDDAVALKSGWDCFGDERGFNRPTKGVVIRNLTVLATSSAAVAIGSEMSGGIEDVLIENLRVVRASTGGALVIKTTPDRGGYVRNVTVRGAEIGNIVEEDRPQLRFAAAGFMIVGRLGGWTPEANPRCTTRPRALPAVSDIAFRDVRQMPGTRISGPPVRFQGLVEGQTLRNITLAGVRLAASSHPGGICSNAEVTVDDVIFDVFVDPARGSGDHSTRAAVPCVRAGTPPAAGE